MPCFCLAFCDRHRQGTGRQPRDGFFDLPYVAAILIAVVISPGGADGKQRAGRQGMPGRQKMRVKAGNASRNYGVNFGADLYGGHHNSL